MAQRGGRHRARTPTPVIAARTGIGLVVFTVSLAVVLDPRPPEREVPVAGNFTTPAESYSLPAPPTAPPPTTTPLTATRAAPRIPSPHRSSHRVKVGKSRGVTPESAPTTSSKGERATSTTSAPQATVAPPSKTPTPKMPAPTKEASSCPSDGITGGAIEWVAIAANYIADQTDFDGTMLGRGGRAGNASSDHPSGYAVDFLTDDGDELADWVLEHRDELGVTYVIWRQRYNDGSGWDKMDDRGSRTANHFDHVHVSFSRTEPDLATFRC